jgi:outer membrane protein assembly factor BamB
MTVRMRTLLPIVLAFIVSACGQAYAASVARPGDAAVAPAAAASAAPASLEWPVYHLNAQRTGYQTDFPTLTGSLTQAWAKSLDGAVYAEPLVVHGHVIVATENDSIYELDAHTGAVLWQRNLGTPVPLSTLPCGNINPLGITGTPAYDPTTNTLFAVAEVTGPAHILFALNPSTGVVRWSRNVDLAGDDPTTHQQRTALAVANGYVYFGFGGLAGDCGQYKGEVLGVPTTGTGATIFYRVPVAREGAVWATGGPVINAKGDLFVSVGNGSSRTTYDGSDSVMELYPSLKLLSRFAPSTWAADNASDHDLGSMSPVLVPGGWVLIAGKSGTAYTLRQGKLGGIGGQVSSLQLCTGFGGASQIGTTIFVPCSGDIAAVHVRTDGTIQSLWRTTSGAGEPPVVGGGAVWSVSLASGRLFALDPATGATIQSISVGPVPHFVSPTLYNGLVFVGTLAGVVAIRA